jgi:tetratricopeptide (TPR) repeat protein
MTARSLAFLPAVVVLALVSAGLHGCVSSRFAGNSPYASASEVARDPAKAQSLAMEAADLIHKDPENAERLLREALAADLWCGTAHNGLGVVELNRGNWYEAASEFEWARKLMPGHPDPRMNLALTLERAGRVDEALATYGTALEVYPNHMPTMQALSRLQLRSKRTDGRTPDMLRQISMGGETKEWRDWAHERLVLMSEKEDNQPSTTK